MRQIKFRAWNHIVGRYSRPFTLEEFYKLKNVQLDCLFFEQFIGLKDKHEKQVYENDLYECEGSLYQIIWDEVWACFDNKMINKPIVTKVNLIYLLSNGEHKGNIHQNPELLK